MGKAAPIGSGSGTRHVISAIAALIACISILSGSAACAMSATSDRALPPLTKKHAVAPIKPDNAGKFEDAPTPNLDLYAPRVGTDFSGPGLQPSLFQQRSIINGDGYTPGSIAPNAPQISKRLPTPGFSLTVPLN